MKRTLSLVLALVMVLGSFTSVFAAEQSVEAKAGAFLKEVEVLAGNTEGDLMLGENLERRDQVILLSKLMKEFETAKEFPTSEESPTWKDNGDKFYTPFLAWAQANEHFSGHSTTKFGPREAITAQDYAAVLLRVLGHDAKETYADSLKLAKELGILADVATLENSTKITRGQMAVMTVNALDVTIKDSTITLAEKLEITMPVAPVVEATKVESVHAENLKEVVVVFDGEVDAVTAEDENNYSTTAGTVDSAVLSEDLTTVILTLVDGTVMTNQKEYTLTVSGVKAGDSKISAEKVKFAPIDNKLPEVAEVKSLGTKALKVIMSEPVKTVNTTMFKIDGKSYFGTATVDGRVITLKPYNSKTVLSVGEHTLTVSKVEDFSTLKSLEQELNFVVVEDNDAPVVVEVKATLERAIVEFNEDVDPDTVTKNSFYWMSGSVKKYPRTATVSGNKVTLDFTNNTLPAYETKLFVNGVADYSGNKLANVEVLVTAQVDQTRPEVLDVKVSKDAKEITVRFNKNVDGTNRTNYAIKDKDNKVVSVKEIIRVNSNSDKDYKVVLYKALPAGINTLTISGVADKTTLKNVMLPQTFELNVGDIVGPDATEFTVTAEGRQIIVTFDKVMDLASISEVSNYLIEVKEPSKAAAYWTKLPEGTEMTPILNGKGIRIILPEYIDEKNDVKYIAGTTVKNIQLMALKDSADNVMMPTVIVKPVTKADAKAYKYDDNVAAHVYAALTDGKTIKIRFDQAIGEVKADGIKVKNGAGTVLAGRVITDESNLVTVELNNSVGTTVYAGNVATIEIDGAKLVTITGGKATTETLTVSNIVDRVKPEVNVEKLDGEERVKVTTQATKDANGKATSTAVMELEFTEILKNFGNEGFDLEITRISDGKTLTAVTDYTVSVSGNKLIITVLQSAVKDSAYTVKVKANASFLQDTTGNKAVESDVFETNSSLMVQ